MTVPVTAPNPPAGLEEAAAEALPPVGAAAVAVVAGAGEAVAVRGLTRPGGPPVDACTRFELGSVTKTFTALLLADLVVAGVVGYDDPIGRYLPAHAVPGRTAARRITLRHLATHSAGLPRVPGNLWLRALPSWRTNPYARYTVDHLYRAVARARPRPAPGTAYRYSNHGMGLLGQLLADATGTDYPRLVAERLCAPLGMADTGAAPGPGSGRALGHRRGRPLPPFRIPGLLGAGGLVSTVADLVRYARAHLTPAATPLAAAVAEVCRPQPVLPGAPGRIGLGWHLHTVDGLDLYFHAGATAGCTAFVGFVPRAHTALVMLNATAYDRRRCQVAHCLRRLKALTRAFGRQAGE